MYKHAKYHEKYELLFNLKSYIIANYQFRFRELDSSKKHGLDSIAEKISIDWMNENERKDDQKTKGM